MRDLIDVLDVSDIIDPMVFVELDNANLADTVDVVEGHFGDGWLTVEFEVAVEDRLEGECDT